MMKSQSSLTVLKVLTGEEYEEPVSVTAAILTLTSPRDGRNWRFATCCCNICKID